MPQVEAEGGQNEHQRKADVLCGDLIERPVHGLRLQPVKVNNAPGEDVKVEMVRKRLGPEVHGTVPMEKHHLVYHLVAIQQCMNCGDLDDAVVLDVRIPYRQPEQRRDGEETHLYAIRERYERVLGGYEAEVTAKRAARNKYMAEQTKRRVDELVNDWDRYLRHGSVGLPDAGEDQRG